MSDPVPDPESDDETPLEQIAGGFAVGLTLLVAFSLLALGVPWFWVAFPVGFAGFLPFVVGVARYYEQPRERGSDGIGRGGETADALELLRERYANGELAEEEFEQRIAALLETEDVESAREYAARRPERQGERGGRDVDHEPEPE